LLTTIVPRRDPHPTAPNDATQVHIEAYSTATETPVAGYQLVHSTRPQPDYEHTVKARSPDIFTSELLQEIKCFVPMAVRGT
jgi:hypothetical protein